MLQVLPAPACTSVVSLWLYTHMYRHTHIKSTEFSFGFKHKIRWRGKGTWSYTTTWDHHGNRAYKESPSCCSGLTVQTAQLDYRSLSIIYSLMKWQSHCFSHCFRAQKKQDIAIVLWSFIVSLSALILKKVW